MLNPSKLIVKRTFRNEKTLFFQSLWKSSLTVKSCSRYLTVPSREALAILSPDAEKRDLVIGLVCPRNVSYNKGNQNVEELKDNKVSFKS